MAVAAVLRAIELNQQLWYDEILTLVRSVRQPLGTIVTTYAQNQHGLYSVLARISILVFGDTAWALRLPAVMFGVVSIPALYFCTRLMTSRREALLSCVLLTVSYHHVWFSQNARGYTGLAFFTLLATFYFLRAMNLAGGSSGSDSNLRWWIAYAVSIALGGYVHLTMLFVLAGHGLVFLWVALENWRLGRLPADWKQAVLGFGLSGMLTLALYAPAWRQMMDRTVGQSGTMVRSEWTNPLWVLLETVRGLGVGAGIGVVAVVVAGAIFLAGLASYWRENKYAVAAVVLPIVITGIVLQLILNVFPRFFFFAIGFGLMWLVRGAFRTSAWICGKLRQNERLGQQLGMATVGLMILASCYQLRVAYYPKQDFAGPMAYVDANRKAGDSVVLAGLTVLPYTEYYGRDWAVVETREQLDAIRKQSNVTWLVYTLPIHFRSRYPELWLEIKESFTIVKEFRGTMGGGEVVLCRSKRAEEPQ